MPTPEQVNDGRNLPQEPDERRLGLMAQTRNRLEQLPDSPRRSGTRERLAAARQSVERETDLTLVDRINHRDTRIPWEQTQEAATPEVRFSEMQNAPLWRRVGLYMRLLKGSNDSYGAHFHAERLHALSDYQKADVVEQLERLDQGTMSWRTKLVSTLMKTHSEYELFKQGYQRAETTGAATEKHAVTAGQTLESIMKSRTGGERLWRSIKDGDVVGPLDFDDPLPTGAHVYFSADGYPVFLSMKDDERPVVPVYRKTDERGDALQPPRDWKWGAEAYRRFEFLQRRMKVGDVILSNNRRDLRTGMRRLFYARGRMLQGGNNDENVFPFIHSMVVVGRDAQGPIIAHLDHKNKPLRSLREMVNADAMDSMSIGRISDESKVESFVKSMTSYSQSNPYASFGQTLEYDRLLAKQQSGKVLTKDEKKKMDSICVCTNAVKQAATQASVQELQNATTALDMFKSLRIVDTMNIQSVAQRGSSARLKNIRLRQAA